MSLQDTPQSERVHIGFFGRRNAGKSSLINAIAGQPVSLVSETLGTTTDPVRKSMEILPLGRCFSLIPRESMTRAVLEKCVSPAVKR